LKILVIGVFSLSGIYTTIDVTHKRNDQLYTTTLHGNNKIRVIIMISTMKNYYMILYIENSVLDRL